jgi:hypothetical protein
MSDELEGLPELAPGSEWTAEGARDMVARVEGGGDAMTAELIAWVSR